MKASFRDGCQETVGAGPLPNLTAGPGARHWLPVPDGDTREIRGSMGDNAVIFQDSSAGLQLRGAHVSLDVVRELLKIPRLMVQGQS